MEEAKVVDAKIITDDPKVLKFFSSYGELIEDNDVEYRKTEEKPDGTFLIMSDTFAGVGGTGKNVVVEPVKKPVYYLVLKKGPGFSTNEVRREAKRSLYGREFSFIPYR